MPIVSKLLKTPVSLVSLSLLLDFDFFDNKAPTTHFKISQDEIEKVFKLIDKKNSGSKVSLKELEAKMGVSSVLIIRSSILTFLKIRSAP